ncbi:signal peptide-containing protein [Theileria equi strain WA]|uniref:Signal peptide-containing protein n=1 Tax=Theileria equi strain WA TaxID=1537102 RepID=L0AYK3_THEEQ|nr:signal peptide-containing protein [Theileria equi strain WA]AFZ80096.1 signal peptide-containing protein [Theileria equi strain WA]|eukprot:XP_004829762.1 signal peptide-containing protein [Theileria equi strain WA]
MFCHLAHSPCLVLFVKFTCALPFKEKYPIDLDISYPLPEHIKVSYSGQLDGAYYAFVKETHVDRFRVGLLTYKGQILSPGNSRDVNKFFFFFATLGHDTEYLRVVSKTLTIQGTTRRKVEEFVRTKDTTRFRRLSRRPVTVNVILQMNTRLVEVAIRGGVGPKRFEIRDGMGFDNVIGVVRYGPYVLTTRTRGLVERIVLWDGGKEQPYITIISLYIDGNCITTKYRYDEGEFGFRIESKALHQVFQNPFDESGEVDAEVRESMDEEDWRNDGPFLLQELSTPNIMARPDEVQA